MKKYYKRTNKRYFLRICKKKVKPGRFYNQNFYFKNIDNKHTFDI